MRRYKRGYILVTGEGRKRRGRKRRGRIREAGEEAREMVGGGEGAGTGTGGAPTGAG